MYFLDKNAAFTTDGGALILVHNRSDTPFTKDGVFAATGAFTNIEVTRTFFSRLPYPFSDCRKDLTVQETDSIYYKRASQNSTYNFRTCYDSYFQFNVYMLKCQCMDPSLRWFNNSLICNTKAKIDCMINITGSNLVDEKVK